MKLLLALALALPLTARAEESKAVLIVQPGGGVDQDTADMLRTLGNAQLRSHGLRVIEAPEFAKLRDVNVEFGDDALKAGANRVFVIRPGRLGMKLFLTLSELSPALDTIYEARLTAANVEEADKIIPRLVETVVKRVPVDDTARLATVTAQEAVPYQKRTGEVIVSAGLPLGLASQATKGAFGLSFSLGYELPYLRIDATAMATGGSDHNAAGLLGFQANYMFMDGEFSPYVGGGVGFMTASNSDYSGGGAGLTAEVGFEALRLHQARIIVGLQALLPLYNATPNNTYSYDSYGNYVASSAQGTQWTPYFLLHVRLAL